MLSSRIEESALMINTEVSTLNLDLEECYDPETGEVIDEKGLKIIQLQLIDLARRQFDGIAQIGAMIQNLKLKTKGLIEAEKRIETSKKQLKRDIDYYTVILDSLVDVGEKYNIPGVVTVTKKMEDTLEILNEDSIPSEFTKTKYKENPLVPDKDKIKEACKAGEDIQGVSFQKQSKLKILKG